MHKVKEPFFDIMIGCSCPHGAPPHPSTTLFNDYIQIISLEKASFILKMAVNYPTKHSSTYYGSYGFRDWVVTDDERMYAILAIDTKYFYTNSIPSYVPFELDISRDDIWTCLDT